MWTIYGDCEYVQCDFQDWVDVQYRDGTAGWTCPFCDYRIVADVPERS